MTGLMDVVQGHGSVNIHSHLLRAQENLVVAPLFSVSWLKGLDTMFGVRTREVACSHTWDDCRHDRRPRVSTNRPQLLTNGPRRALWSKNDDGVCKNSLNGCYMAPEALQVIKDRVEFIIRWHTIGPHSLFAAEV